MTSAAGRSAIPTEAGFGFCGCQKAAGVPYCEHHAAIAYNPAARRRRAA